MGYIRFNISGNEDTTAQEQIVNINHVISARLGMGNKAVNQLNLVLDTGPIVADETPTGTIEVLSIRGANYTAATVKRFNDAIIASQNQRTGVTGPGVVDVPTVGNEEFIYVSYQINED